MHETPCLFEVEIDVASLRLELRRARKCCICIGYLLYGFSARITTK